MLLWSVLFIVSIVFELITPTALVSIWFSIGAIFSLIAAYFQLNLTIQLIIFFTISLLCVIAIRPLAKNYLRGNVVATNADRAIGKHCHLLKEITIDSLGEVKVNGVTWNARSYNQQAIEKDCLVEILAIDGTKVVVKKIDQ